MYGATVGKLGILAIDAAMNQAICAIFTPPEIDKKYVFWFFLYYRDELLNARIGGAQPNISQQILRQVRIPLPSLPEQQRIVAKIEELFTQLDAGVAALEKARVQLRRYRQAVLKAAVEGELTREWREAHRGELEPASVLLERILEERRAKWKAEQLAKLEAKGKKPKDDKWKQKYKKPSQPDANGLYELPKGWIRTTLDQLSYHVTSGSRGWAKHYADTGALFVRVGNFNRLDTAIDLQEPIFVTAPTGPEADRTRLQIGDLLITITADVGMVGIVRVLHNSSGGHHKAIGQHRKCQTGPFSIHCPTKKDVPSAWKPVSRLPNHLSHDPVPTSAAKIGREWHI